MAAGWDWGSGDGLLGLDSPEEWDGAFERGADHLGTAAIGLAFNCSLDEASPRIVRAMRLPDAAQRGFAFTAAGHVARLNGTLTPELFAALRAEGPGGIADFPVRDALEFVPSVPEAAVMVEATVGVRDGARQTGGLVAAVRGRVVDGWRRLRGVSSGYDGQVKMTDLKLTGTSEPWVFCLPQREGASAICAQLSELETQGGRVYRFDSHDLATEQGVHRSFAAALQFPKYYGRNWDALVDCLDDLCGEVTGGTGVAGIVHGTDRLLDAEHFPLFVSVLCQGAARANSSVDADGCLSDRPAVSQHFVFEFSDFNPGRIALRLSRPDLTVTTGDGFVAASLNPQEWY
ncbi:barstar family protein [Streptomyces sp. BB1-1-1]|uniref:barstar family protein n=1 Tax=Streptomyces sp. BB1-1-1 TaxID=3074430 RepID=UPI002877A1BF|nr:barstar family protein [Streptomyces sp. BB1-1-1]WND35733.1 barstar family protein [Streptomyces sp. BB1-1-1]